MATTLRELGFEVIEGIDLDKPGLDQKARDFVRGLTTADTAVFYYAGHGLQVGGRNYLLPIEAKLESERDLQFEAVAVDAILQQMELERENKTSIILLDACRDNPLARNLARSMGTRSGALGRGLAQVQSGVGSFISYSTQPGNVALDGDGSNSPFTAALAKRIKTPGKTLSGVMIEVRNDVLKATGGKQVPWDHSALTGEFYFVPQADVVAAAPTQPSNSAEVAALKERMQQLEAQLARQPTVLPPQAKEPAALAPGKPAVIASEASEPRTASGCRTVGRVLRQPVSVAPNDELCADGGRERAKIIAVRDYGVVYATDGKHQTTCKPGQRCSFNWVGAPIFTSRLSKLANGSPRAELVPLN